jgi:hypothetical protein
MSAKKETCPSGQSPRSGDKTGRSIRRPGRKCVRLKSRARTGFEPWAKRTGASPSCRVIISQSLPSSLIPSFSRNPGRKRPLSVGRVGAPFIQRQLTMPQFRSFVNDFQKTLQLANGSAIINARHRPAAQPKSRFGLCRRFGKPDVANPRLGLTCKEWDQGNYPSFNAAAPFLDSTLAAVRSRPSGHTKRFKAERTDTMGPRAPHWSSY